MSDPDPEMRSTPGALAGAVFFVVNVVLFPFTVAGYAIWTIGFVAGRRPGVSRTAEAPLMGRWSMHQFGVRPDETSNRLLRAMTPTPPDITFGPLLLARRLSGYVPKLFRYPFEGEITLGNQGGARQTFYDGVVEQYLPRASQFVILGAGFDTRAINLPRDVPVRAFEVDAPATQAFKREVLAKAGIDASHVTFVSASFETDDWLVRLVKAGFDPSRPALFIWEGVTMYLERTAIEATLRKIASLAQGSVLAFDYFTSEVLEGRSLYLRSVRASCKASGEPLKFGVDSTPPSRERLTELLQSCGLTLIEQRTHGQETTEKRAWGGFAVATVK